MKKHFILISLILIFVSTLSFAADDKIQPSDIPEEVNIEFGKVITVEKGKNFFVLVPGRDYIPNRSKDNTGKIEVINVNSTDGYIYLKGSFNDVGQYLIKIQNNYFLFNVIDIDNTNCEKIQL